MLYFCFKKSIIIIISIITISFSLPSHDPHWEKVWFKRLRETMIKIESDRSAERFKNYSFLSDSLGGMAIDFAWQSGGVLKMWDTAYAIFGDSVQVIDYQVDGNNIGILYQNWNFYVNDTNVLNDVKDFQLEGNRCAVLYQPNGSADATFRVREKGRWPPSYTDYAGNGEDSVIKFFHLDSTRIGLVVRVFNDSSRQYDYDKLLIRDGSLVNPWQDILHASFIYSIQVEKDRIGVLCDMDSLVSYYDYHIPGVHDSVYHEEYLKSYKKYNRLLVKRGTNGFVCVREHILVDTTHIVRNPDIQQTFTFPDTVIKAFQLNNNRIAIVERHWPEPNNRHDDMLIQDSLFPSANWVFVDSFTLVKAIQLQGSRFGILRRGGVDGNDKLWIYDGPVQYPMQGYGVYESPLIKAFHLESNRIAVLTENSLLINNAPILPDNSWEDTLQGSFDSFILTTMSNIKLMTLEGSNITISTTTAGYTLKPYSIEITRNIPDYKQLGQIYLALPTHWSLRKNTSGAVFLTGKSIAPFRQPDYWARINGDGLVMLQSLLGERMHFEKNGTYGVGHDDLIVRIPETPYVMMQGRIDVNNATISNGGIAFFPIGPKYFELAENSVVNTASWYFHLVGGQYFYISIFPPKNFDWSRANERIFFHSSSSVGVCDESYPTNDYIDALTDTTLCDFNKNIDIGEADSNILLLQSDKGMWEHWNLYYEPRDQVRFKNILTYAISHLLRTLVYCSPCYFSIGSYNHPNWQMIEKTDPCFWIYYGENSDHYLAAIDTLINHGTYCPEPPRGVYLDEMYSANLPETYRLIKQLKTMFQLKYGPYHRIVYHASAGFLTGDEDVFCPTIDAYCDFVTRGEFWRYSDVNYDNDYFRRYVSGYNMSNSIGIICNWRCYQESYIEEKATYKYGTLNLGREDNWFHQEPERDDTTYFCSNFRKYRIKIQYLKSIIYNGRCFMHRNLHPTDQWHKFYYSNPLHDKPINIWYKSDYNHYLTDYPRNQEEYGSYSLPGYDEYLLSMDYLPDSTHYATLIQPRICDTFYTAEPCTVIWQSWGDPGVMIEYSTNGGNSFTSITSEYVSSYNLTNNKWYWEVPNFSGTDTYDNCLIRIIGSFPAEPSHLLVDVSDTPFIIIDTIIGGGSAGGDKNMSEAVFVDFHSNPIRKIIVNYSIAKQQEIEIQIYDITGRLVTRDTSMKRKGTYTYAANNLASGIYFVQFKAQKKEISRKVILVK